MERPPDPVQLAVLLVEDNPADAAMVRHTLDSYQPGRYAITHVSRVQEAVEQVARQAFSIALLDLNLPDMQGADTFATLSDAAPGLPVIVLTGLSDHEMAVRLVQMGAQDFLLKDELDGALMSRAIRYAMARKRIEQKLEEAAHFDRLTGLPNRTLFHDRLERAIARAERGSSQISLLFLDLDRFKEVNDTLGHAAGDELLGQIGRRFESIMRKNDTVARMGGDEFTVIVEDVQSSETVFVIAEKLLGLFGTPFCVAGEEVYVGGSIGIAFSAESGLNADTLLRHADDAMYRAKECGGERYWVYSADIQPSMPPANPKAAELPPESLDLLTPRLDVGEVLLVDDSPGDRRLITEAFRESRSAHRLRIASDGEKAIACLRRPRSLADHPLPKLILLDLNMPGRNGFDILQEIRSVPELARTPVVVLSTSASRRDVADAYRLGADGYVTKPEGFEGFVKMIGTVIGYWLDVVQGPPSEGEGA